MKKPTRKCKDTRPAIERVIYDHFGSVLKCARAMTARRSREAGYEKVTEISDQNVRYWMKVSVPPDVAKALELESGGFVTRAELRPDIFE
jgi:hypothetical protein